MITSEVPNHLIPFLEALPVCKWVSRVEILQRTGQSDYRRRIAQLRNEYGYDIEVYRKNGEWHYHRVSVNPVRPRQVRKYPSAKQRKRIYARDKYVCQLCLSPTGEEPDKPSPQIDHKIPLIRFGGEDDDNLQTLCMPCNIRKRRACATCEREDCEECPLAFPEKLPQRLVLPLSSEVMERLAKAYEKSGQPLEVVVGNIIQDWLESRRQEQRKRPKLL